MLLMRHSFRVLRHFISYDPKSGIFKWLRNPGKKIKTGSVAGNVGINGYRRIGLDGHLYQAHRIAFLLMNGAWPKKDIDHLNGHRDDNRWSNLREVSRTHNLLNRSGVNGYARCRDKFHARIHFNGKTIHLGSFPTRESARAAYAAAKLKISPKART